MFESGQYGDSITLSYYAMYSSVFALLLKKGYIQTHECTLRQLAKEYVKEGLFKVGVEYILSSLDFFEEEYYDFSSIKYMMFHILENKSLLHNISMFEYLINSFYNLVQFKKDYSNEEYEKRYEDFFL